MLAATRPGPRSFRHFAPRRPPGRAPRPPGRRLSPAAGGTIRAGAREAVRRLRPATEPGPGIERQARTAAKAGHARLAERCLQWLGWPAAVPGVLGVIAQAVLWADGSLGMNQAVSLILGTALAAILSGATAYGADVRVGPGRERLELAALAARPPGNPGRPATFPG